MDANPYLTDQKLNQLRQEINEKGFKPDPILLEGLDQPVYGFNLSIGLPLPTELKKDYAELKRSLLCLGSNIYVYPFEQTHITLLTIVNFKEYLNPSKKAVSSLQEIVHDIIELLKPLFERNSSLRLKPFNIDFGPPVLSIHAAFLPIRNRGKEVIKLREAAARVLEPYLLQTLKRKIKIPDLIHTTIFRFRRRPADEKEFISKFDQIASNFRINKVAIKEIMLTAEIKPYMHDFEILHHFSLKE